MKLYVGNLCHSMTEAKLTELFSCFGVVKRAHIIKDHHTRQSKNFGYIEMSSLQDGRDALAGMDGQTVNHRLLVVREARPRDERFGLGW